MMLNKKIWNYVVLGKKITNEVIKDQVSQIGI